MCERQNVVAIDNDFLNHILETELEESVLIKTLNELLSFFNVQAIIHPLVFKYEVPENKKVKTVFNEGFISKVEFENIIKNDDEKKYYIFLIRMLYRALLGKQLEFSDDEIFNRWIRKESLGEIHSVSMCLVCDFGVFLSDDGDAKKLKEYIEKNFIGTIDIYNRKQMFEKYKESGGSAISRTERNRMCHIR